MPNLIFSFRQNDQTALPSTLYQHLAAQYGAESITYGVENLIRHGDDYRDAIIDGVQACQFLLVIIGPDWMEGGWLNDEEDYDYIAIKAAIDSKTRMIPITGDAVHMPVAAVLPDDLQSLGRRKPIFIDPNDFYSGVQVLDTVLEAELTQASPPPPQTPPVYGAPPYNYGYAPQYPMPGQLPYIAVQPSAYQRLGLKPADLATRTGAFVVDAIIIVFVSVLLVLGARAWMGTNEVCTTPLYSFGTEVCREEYSRANLVGYAASVVFMLIFHGYFLTRHNGQTPGKMLAGIRVVKDNGAPLTLWESTVRNVIGYFLSGILMFFGFVWAFLDQDRRTWHDMLSSTVVVQA